VEVAAAANPPETVPSNGFSNELAANQVQTAELSKSKRAANAKAVRAAAVPQWTLSANGNLQRSFDQGRTWQPVSVPTNATFRALSSTASDVWVGGKAGLLLHSPDSGATWSTVRPNSGGEKLSSDIVHIDFPSARDGLVTTTNGETWITSDGGKSWIRK